MLFCPLTLLGEDRKVFVVCVPYYSLPEFPNECVIVRDHDLFLRDILLCNKRNFHFKGGVQYDPHIETSEYLNCQPLVRQSISIKAREYDDLYILFRTCFLKLDQNPQYFVTGYYKVKHEFNEICRDAPVIKASESRFISRDESINITSVMAETRAFRSCPTTENKNWEGPLSNWLNNLTRGRDLTSRCVKEINRLKTIFREQEFSESKQGYADCECCDYENDLCPLVWRRHHRGIPPMFPPHFT